MTLVLPTLSTEPAASQVRVRGLFASDRPLPRGLIEAGVRIITCPLTPVLSMTTLAMCARAARARVVILDVDGRERWESDVRVLARARGLRVVVTSDAPGAEPVRAAVRAGALGFVRATASAMQWQDALMAVGCRTAFVAHVAVDPEGAPCPEASGAGRAARRGVAGPMPFESELTPREREVVRLVMEGLTGGAIALRLGVTLKTVQTHQMNVRAKLHAGSRLQQFRRVFLGWPELLVFDPVVRARIGDAAHIAALVLEPAAERLLRLSPREREALDAVVRGGNRHDIATALGINDKTFDSHLAGIRKKLGVSSTLELARLIARLRPERRRPAAVLRRARSVQGVRYAEAS